MKKYAKDIQGDSPLENPLPKSRATAVRVATLLRRTVLSVALAMRGFLAIDFLSALAMNSGVSRVHRGLLHASKSAPQEQAIRSARRFRAPSPAALDKGDSKGGTPLAAFATFSPPKR